MLASWLNRPLKLEATGLYGFVHSQDPNFNLFLQAQGALGLGQGGPIQNVDGLTLVQLSSNRLTSTRTDIPSSNFHGSVAVDWALPTDPSGNMGYIAVWEYLFGVARFRNDFE